MNGTVDAATAQQGIVGRVDNGIDLQLGDITLDNFNHGSSLA
jgi:hypothetical protein